MLLNITETIGSLSVDVLFDKPINLFTGLSGQGKTYLFSILYGYCHIKGIPCVSFNYKDVSMDKAIMAEMCSKATVILFDNADLYLTDALLNTIKQDNKLLIISMKKHSNNLRKLAHFCKIRYKDTSLWVR